MTWKSLGPVREGSQQSSTSAPFNLSASRSASNISGATRFLDMYTFASLNGFGFIIFSSKLNFIYHYRFIKIEMRIGRDANCFK